MQFERDNLPMKHYREGPKIIVWALIVWANRELIVHFLLVLPP